MQGGEAVGGGEGEGFVALGDDALVACDEGEVFYMPLEVVELEFEGFFGQGRGFGRVERVEVQVFKVGNEDVFGFVAFFFQKLHVFQGLVEGGFQIFAARFHFDEQQAGKETVDAVDAFAVCLSHAEFEFYGVVRVEAVYAAQGGDEFLRLTHFVGEGGAVFGEAVGVLPEDGGVGHGWSCVVGKPVVY